MSGLWPLLVNGIGVIDPAMVSSSPGQHTADEVLARAWRQHLPLQASPYVEEILADMQPYGARWPGASVRPPALEDPGTAADSFADRQIQDGQRLLLGLVATDRAADVIAVLGWSGAANYRLDNGEIAAVLRDWECRFGARVVSLGGSLDLSVAAPPQSESDALRVAAEHLAFCPENITFNLDDTSLRAYAERLIGARSWSFWWD